MYPLYLTAKVTKYIALASLVVTFFSDLMIFKWLCCLIFIDLAMEFPVFKCSLLQIIGLFQVKRRYKGQPPSVETYQSEVDYILPFHGRWVAVNGCFQKEHSHSWGIPTQRYAYDFLILDEHGKSHHGPSDRCDSYYCYDQEILSPADGVVVVAVDGASDSLIFPNGRFFSSAWHIAGNYLVIRHAAQEYSTLAHLKKGSITVKVGDSVQKGQPISRCGNTGNSTEPHLHFQLQTGQSFYSSAGLPVRFRGIGLSRPANYDCFDPRPNMPIDQIPSGYLTRGYAAENTLL